MCKYESHMSTTTKTVSQIFAQLAFEEINSHSNVAMSRTHTNRRRDLVNVDQLDPNKNYTSDVNYMTNVQKKGNLIPGYFMKLNVAISFSPHTIIGFDSSRRCWEFFIRIFFLHFMDAMTESFKRRIQNALMAMLFLQCQ